ncbi:MAG: DEAD/DEAH box helicase [Candidatus Nealsonbacteria bacterium]|nr:DEAD/DEAH box helicase [Candidatus Nealsonbacteria bacterium]
MNEAKSLSQALIAGVTPYFLKRGAFWFEENREKLLQARRTRSFFQKNILSVEQNQKHNFSHFLRRLDEMGYEKVYQVSEMGEFAQRGGVVDVFPVNLNKALRFEFLGNTIETIEEMPVTVGDGEESRKLLEKKLKSQEQFFSLEGLKPGDYVVHLDHGIGRFEGMTEQQRKEKRIQYYVIGYDRQDKLYVPSGLERKLSLYVGFTEPQVSRLGSPLWQKKKKKVKEDAKKLAKELLKIYANREVATRPPYLVDDEIEAEVAASFPYQETPDQKKAIQEIKEDLEKTEPMDRLLCADVGFGKTEVALRAMVKTVKSGWQTAFLCPTTILANQHFQNFQERLDNLPINIALLSRFQSKKEQKEIIKKLKEKEIDIVIGTHRLLSKDVSFQKLGLLIIDDEHRFGVKQKEKLKKMRASLNVLSLSATPIPRTLYLALSSLRDISTIRTPPPERRPVETFVKPFSEKIIKKAIQKEVSRGGQVYYLHNRIETIQTAKKFLKNLLPDISFGIAHGSLNEKQIMEVMDKFQKKEIDVLIATTIIENGLDFPNVNTLIVSNSTRLGLAEAHQLRGRVGRSYIKASAYFLHRPHRLTKKAKQRLQTLEEAQSLGAGYRIALKDLEIRGAGNILGKEQSGSINQVGLNLYCQMLFQEIERIKKEA